MSAFDRWLTFAVGDIERPTDADYHNDLCGEEGGWTPTDPSPENPTMRGLEYEETKAFLQQPDMTIEQFRAIVTRTLVAQITKENYWVHYAVDLLPQGSTVLYMDGVFNGGGVENLQVVMNGLLGAGLKVDGMFGPITNKAMERLMSIPAQQIIFSYYLAAEARYKTLGKEPRFAPFLSDWLGRLGRCTTLAKQITQGASL